MCRTKEASGQSTVLSPQLPAEREQKKKKRIKKEGKPSFYTWLPYVGCASHLVITYWNVGMFYADCIVSNQCLDSTLDKMHVLHAPGARVLTATFQPRKAARALAPASARHWADWTAEAVQLTHAAPSRSMPQRERPVPHEIDLSVISKKLDPKVQPQAASAWSIPSTASLRRPKNAWASDQSSIAPKRLRTLLSTPDPRRVREGRRGSEEPADRLLRAEDLNLGVTRDRVALLQESAADEDLGEAPVLDRLGDGLLTGSGTPVVGAPLAVAVSAAAVAAVACVEAALERQAALARHPALHDGAEAHHGERDLRRSGEDPRSPPPRPRSRR
jgi:hypothetical protein